MDITASQQNKRLYRAISPQIELAAKGAFSEWYLKRASLRVIIFWRVISGLCECRHDCSARCCSRYTASIARVKEAIGNSPQILGVVPIHGNLFGK